MVIQALWLSSDRRVDDLGDFRYSPRSNGRFHTVSLRSLPLSGLMGKKSDRDGSDHCRKGSTRKTTVDRSGYCDDREIVHPRLQSPVSHLTSGALIQGKGSFGDT